MRFAREDVLINPSYACATLPPPASPSTAPAITMQNLAVASRKSVSQDVVDFARHIAVPQTSTTSPLIMDAVYGAAANYAWLVRESGDEDSQRALDDIRERLRDLGSRWRCAAEYLRILEAQEFTYAIGGAGA